MDLLYIRNGSNITDEDDCYMIYKIPAELKCKYVTDNKACDREDLMHAHYLLYCLMGDSVVAPFVLMFMILLLFTVVGIIADDFICPLMAALASLLQLSESVAGVTILALANGTPDLMSAMSSLERNSPETMFCSLIGGGLIDTTLVVGTIIFLERFRFQPLAMVRDCGFYLFSVLLFFLFYLQQEWTLMNSIIFVVIYMIYAAVVLARYFYELAKTIALGMTTDKKDIIIQELQTSKNVQEEKLIVHKEFRTLWNDFWIHVAPEEGHFEGINMCSKIIKYFVVPISFTLKLMIPQFNYTIENNGWSKSLYMINAFLFPLVTVFCFNYLSVPEYLGECISVGLIFALTVYITTSRLEKPRYHNLVAIHVFFTSFSVVNIVVNSIISLLNAVASKFYISRTSLPLTILAVGNTIGDFVTNINLARSGLPRMAIAACYAGPLFNLVFDAGFTTMYVFLVNEKTSMKVSLGVMGPIGVLFLFLVLISTITVLPLIYFDARKSFAIFLFVVYSKFILYIILIETGVIYPLGESKYSTYDDTHYDDQRECDPVYSDCVDTN